MLLLELPPSSWFDRCDMHTVHCDSCVGMMTCAGKDLSGIIRVYYESGSYRTLRVLATTTVFEVKEQLIDHLLVQLCASLTRVQSLHIIGRHQQYALFRVEKNAETPMYTALADDDNPWLYFQSETRDRRSRSTLLSYSPS
jgi:hypothetical protein